MIWRGGRDSNPRPSAWQADTLNNWATTAFLWGLQMIESVLSVQSEINHTGMNALLNAWWLQIILEAVLKICI